MTAAYQFRQEDFQPRTVPTASGVTVAGLWLIFISLIFLQRFAIGGVPIAYGVSYTALLAFVLLGVIVIDAMFLIFFLVAVAIASISTFWWPASASLKSFLLLVSIYALFALRFRDREATLWIARSIYLKCMLVAAIAGILQFVLQFVLGPERVFPLESLPESILAQGYNVVIPLTYGSPIMKSNGVFFLEPSFFSQFLAFALIIELLGRQRAIRCCIYLLAMLLSYSGTGLVTTLLFAPIVLARRISLPAILACFCAGLLVVFSMSVWEFDTLFARMDEFSSKQSSGFARFLSPFYLIRDFLLPSPNGFLFGMGPGTIDLALGQAPAHGYLAHDPTWIKLIYEYGLVGGLAIMSYVVCAMYVGSRDKLFSTVIMAAWLVLGGYLLNGLMAVFFISLSVLHSFPANRAIEPPMRPRRARTPVSGRSLREHYVSPPAPPLGR